MKKFFLSALAAVMLAFPAFAAEEVLVGEISTSTGDFAAYGFAEVESVNIALEEINAAGGVKVGDKMLPMRVIQYDCRTRNEDMVNAARRLVNQDKVVAVIGPSGSGLCISAAAVFNRGHVSHLGTLPTNPMVTMDERGKVRPYNFRICFLDPYQGAILATFAIKNLNLKKAAVLYDVSSDYSQGLREFFINEYKKMGGEVVADEGHRGEDVDFRAQLTKFKEANPEILVFPTMGKCTPLAIKQAREMGFTCPIIGGDGYGDFWWEIAGDAMENTYWVSHVDKGDPKLKSFFDKFEAKTGTECKEFMNAVMAYDCLYWLKDAVERAGSTDPEKVRDALEQTKDLKLFHCTLTMDEFHNPKGKEGIMLKAEGGKTKYFATIKPEM